LFKLRAWQSFCTTSVHVLFGLPLGLEPSTSYSIYFFTQSVSSFCSTCPYHRNLFCCSINIISIPSLSLNSSLGTLSFYLLPPNLTSASALPGETGNPTIASFHLNAACFFIKKTRNTVKNITWSELNHPSLSK